jgi:preprotein translocase subunit SecA
LEEEKNENIRNIKLQIHDMFWVEHLEMMDYLRNSVNLRAYGQRDPLVEYKKEGLRLFKQMEESVANTIAENLEKLTQAQALSAEQSAVRRQAERIVGGDNSSLSTSPPTPARMPQAGRPLPRLRNGQVAKERGGEGKKIGRNDPCWCGSGKKFKKCHGK